MDKNENIHIKLEISRDPTTGHLNLMTRFDPNAPNFIKDEDGFSWSPTRIKSVPDKIVIATNASEEESKKMKIDADILGIFIITLKTQYL